MIKNWLKKKLLTMTTFVVSALVVEMILFLYLGFGVLPIYWVLDVSLIFFFAFIIFVLPNNWIQNAFLGLVLAFQIVIAYANICIYNVLADIFTFDLFSLVGETANVITADMLFVWPAIFFGLVIAVDVVALIFINKIKVEKLGQRNEKKFIVNAVITFGLALCMLVYSIATISFPGNKEDENYLLSDKVLFQTFSSNKNSLIKFGSYGFYFEEFFRRFYKTDQVLSYTKAELESYLSETEYDPKSTSLFGVDKGNNVLVIMAESFEWYAINPELTPTLYALANGYDFGTKTIEGGKISYSNFDFYNFDADGDGVDDVDENGFLVFKRADYDYDEIEKKYTKNEINLFDNSLLFGTSGLSLVNFYGKSKTDYSEASVILGNYPYNESYTTHGGIFGNSSTNLYSNVNYNFTLPSMLLDTEAVEVANYMHSFNSTFYGRDTLITQFGFDKTLFLDQMNNSIPKTDRLCHATLDSKVMDYYLNICDEDENFMPKDKQFLSFFTSVTTHGEYTRNPLLEEYGYYEFLESEDVNYLGKTINGINNANLSPEMAEDVKNYIASALDTEYMMTIILKYLMENNLFENTSIVFFSDHCSYYDTMDIVYKSLYFSDKKDNKHYSSPIYWERNKAYGQNYTASSQDRYKIPAFIYSTKITDAVVGSEENSHRISKFTTHFDLTTSIFTLLGIDYNPNIYLGYPVVCEALQEDGSVKDLGIPMVVSSTGGIFNNNLFTEDGVRILNKNTNVTDEYITDFTRKQIEYTEKWLKITALYKYNLFYKIS